MPKYIKNDKAVPGTDTWVAMELADQEISNTSAKN